MSSGKRKVISVGDEAELLWLRHAVLNQAGFHVHTVQNEKEALDLMHNGHCDVLLMCYSMSREVRERLATTFRKVCPNSRIVAITNAKLDEPDFADTFVYGVEGPEALIEAIQ